MEITDVKVIPVDDEKLKAFVSIVFDQCFVVTDIKIIHGPKGLFVSMPSKKRKDGTFKDIAHPLNNQMRQYLEDKVLSVYRQQVAQRSSAAPEPSGSVEAGGAAAAGDASRRSVLSGASLGSIAGWGVAKRLRRGALNPVSEGSNPSAPATSGASEMEGLPRKCRRSSEPSALR